MYNKLATVDTSYLRYENHLFSRNLRYQNDVDQRFVCVHVSRRRRCPVRLWRLNNGRFYRINDHYHIDLAPTSATAPVKRARTPRPKYSIHYSRNYNSFFFFLFHSVYNSKYSSISNGRNRARSNSRPPICGSANLGVYFLTH